MLETKTIYKKKTLLTKNLTYNNKTILMSILHEYMFTSAGCLESPSSKSRKLSRIITAHLSVVSAYISYY